MSAVKGTSTDSRNDRHCKFNTRDVGMNSKKAYDRSLNRQQDKKIVRKGDFCLTNPEDDQIAVYDTLAEHEQDCQQSQSLNQFDQGEDAARSSSLTDKDIKDLTRRLQDQRRTIADKDKHFPQL